MHFWPVRLSSFHLHTCSWNQSQLCSQHILRPHKRDRQLTGECVHTHSGLCSICGHHSPVDEGMTPCQLVVTDVSEGLSVSIFRVPVWHGATEHTQHKVMSILTTVTVSQMTICTDRNTMALASVDARPTVWSIQRYNRTMLLTEYVWHYPITTASLRHSYARIPYIPHCLWRQHTAWASEFL